MINVKEVLVGHINSDNNLSGKLNNGIEKIYPELEDLNVVPKGEIQNFKSDKYGYNNVTVQAVNLQEKETIPTKEEQQILPDKEYSGLSKVSIKGEENLVSENIKKGISIFNIEGSYEGNTEFNSSILPDKTTNTKFNLGSFVKSFPYIDTSNITNMSKAFMYSHIETIPLLDTSKVTKMESTFESCKDLKTIPIINTSEVTIMTSLFRLCESLEIVPLLDTSNVTKMDNMFYNCIKLKEIPELDTSKVTSMASMFYQCDLLEKVPLLNAEKVVNVSFMFQNCNNLKDFGGLKNLGKAFTYKSENYSNYRLSLYSEELTVESLMNVINNLYDLNLTYNVSGGGTLYRQKLSIGNNKDKLTDEQIAIATNKGWNVE